LNVGILRRRDLRRVQRLRNSLLRRGQRHVLGQVEMNRPPRLRQGNADGVLHSLRYAPAFEPKRRFGDRRKQRVVVDPHLDAATELIRVEIAGDGDEG
jgi:hypothetical protein